MRDDVKSENPLAGALRHRRAFATARRDPSAFDLSALLDRRRSSRLRRLLIVGLAAASGVGIGALATWGAHMLHGAHDSARSTQEGLAATIEALADGVLVFDRDEQALQINSALRALLALDQHPELIPRIVRDRDELLLLRDADGQPLPREQGPIQRILNGETLAGSSAVSVRMRTLDGREIEVCDSGAPIRDAQGNVVGGVLSVRDVTEQRRLEREAREAGRAAEDRVAQLEAVLDALTDAVYVYDADGRIQRTNAAGRSLLARTGGSALCAEPPEKRLPAYEARDAEGRLLPSERWPVLRLLAGDVLTGLDSVDLVMRTRDGDDLQMNTSGAPIYDAAGRLIGAVAITRDVTERRRLERRTAESLEALLAMAEALVQASERPVEEDAETRDTFTAARVIGRRMAELTQRVLDCQRVGILVFHEQTGALQPLAVVSPSDADAREWWARARVSRLVEQRDTAVRAQLRAGESVILDLTQPAYYDTLLAPALLIAPLRIGERFLGALRVDYGAAPHTFGLDEMALVSGIARLAALVIERERLLGAAAEARRLAELDRVRSEFIATVSHNLRTPLTAVQAGLGLLAASLGERLRPEEGDLLAATRRSATRLGEEVNDLLAVNQLDAGTLRLDPAPLDLRAVVQGVVAGLLPLFEAKRQELHIDLPAPLPIRGDGGRLGQVIANLLANAHRHTPAGTRITISGAVTDDETRLTVQDTGPGIPAEELEAVFGRFHRLDPAAGGSGLGLAIVRGIVELHGGRVWAERPAVGGVAFHITLPRLAPDDVVGDAAGEETGEA